MSLSLTGTAPLDATEAEHLADCETIIAAGLASFVEVGEALADVRDRRLYRQTHGTFEDYCSDRWGLSRRHVNRMVEASQVVGALGPIGPTPTNEAQARPLAPLRDDPEALASAWQAANQAAEAKGKPVTAADVAAAVKAQQPEPDPTPIEDDEWEPGGWLPSGGAETGNASGPDADDVPPSAPVEDTPAPTIDVADLVPDELLYRLKASKAVVKARDLLLLDPEKVIATLPVEDLDAFRMLAEELRAYGFAMTVALDERTNPKLRSVK